MSITSTEPVTQPAIPEKVYDTWRILECVNTNPDAGGAQSLRATYRLCYLDKEGAAWFHPTEAPRILDIPDMAALAKLRPGIAELILKLNSELDSYAVDTGVIK